MSNLLENRAWIFLARYLYRRGFKETPRLPRVAADHTRLIGGTTLDPRLTERRQGAFSVNLAEFADSLKSGFSPPNLEAFGSWTCDPYWRKLWNLKSIAFSSVSGWQLAKALLKSDGKGDTM